MKKKKSPLTLIILCLCLVVAYGIYSEKHPPQNDIEQEEDIEVEDPIYTDESDYSDYDTNTYNYNSQDESDYTSDSSEKKYEYDRSDPYYSAHDKDGDGKLTEEEWQDAMSDAINDLYEEMYGD